MISVPSQALRNIRLLFRAGNHKAVLLQAPSTMAASTSTEQSEILHIAATAALQLGNQALAERYWLLAVEKNPNDAGALFHLGLFYAGLARLEDANQCYNRALSLAPNHPLAAMALVNRGNTARLQGRMIEAEADYIRAAHLQPALLQAWLNLASVRLMSGNYAGAGEAYGKVHTAQPNDPHTLLGLLFTRRSAAQWDDDARLADQLPVLLAMSSGTPALPFAALMFGGLTPALHRQISFRYATALHAAELQQAPLVTTPATPRPRLHIGYLSADIAAHATVYLLAGVLGSHDSERFQISLYAYGPQGDTPERQQLAAEGIRIVDMSRASDEQFARQIASDGVDILVDLKGFTRGSRTAINARRPAPVIVNWLGYPGTLGHPRMADYIIGDAVVTPLEHAHAFSETIAQLPDCYQPNDGKRPIGQRPSRAEAGLPYSGLVFCNFNQTFKLSPELFASWCKLLEAVPGSVLWQLETAPEVQQRLAGAAADLGMDPSRLIFAKPLPQAEHLARLQLADLALDTFPCNSHTTASDALWAGVPLITRQGEHFASRVAASLLRCAGLPELVTDSNDSYFATALALALNPAKLTDLRDRVQQARTTSPLFDTERFTRNLEALYLRIWQQECNGERRPIAATG